jgi:hypothetical protein
MVEVNKDKIGRIQRKIRSGDITGLEKEGFPLKTIRQKKRATPHGNCPINK